MNYGSVCAECHFLYKKQKRDTMLLLFYLIFSAICVTIKRKITARHGRSILPEPREVRKESVPVKGADISMRKNVKLSNKKKGKTPEKEPFYFFVKDQGEGAARVVVIVLKIIDLILTSIFALCLGIFGSIIMMAEIKTAAMYMWLISSAVYVIGTFVVMLGHSKIALCVHGAAAAGTIVTYYLFQVMFAQIPENNGPSVLYMPCLFITIITFVIMLLINLPKWLEKQAAKAREVAPSILSKDEEE